MHCIPPTWIIFAMVALLGTRSAQADVAITDEPETSSEITVPLVTSVDRRASVNRLVIPKEFLEAAANAQLGAFRSSLPTIIAGLAVSLALASLVLVRGRSRALNIAVAVAILAVGVFAAVQFAKANAPIDEYDYHPRRRAPQPAATDSVVIEIVDGGDAVQFIQTERRSRTAK